ncbi:DNA topoisomerase III [Parashewanella tropica]|uniref:DNA topoisomerase III n=1 Tax=Parashewanella tropica TaxID=2547970 RepID=UPI001059BA2C|nr:DNA topoisomerase III [Parashewanella tropica]
MLLYIAEKPSLGRAIADVLPKPHKKHDGYIELANGDCVSWCIGHLLETAEPDAYDEKYKSWKLEHLPIIPEKWQLKPKPKTRKQLTTLRKLVKQSTQIVNAGDPDREGQLLVDEVISHLGVSGTKLNHVQRLLISDLNPAAVKRALNNLRSNREFIPLATSALARSRADWLYGINLTRAYTIQGKKVGYDGVLSVGRVQTPLLGLVVRRDEQIQQFQSKPFYEVLAHLLTEQNEGFVAKWQPSEACQPYMDEEGRVLAKGLAENVVNRIGNQVAEITKLETKDKKQNPPLTYNLSSLQIDCAKRFAMSAQDVLSICQSLYEKHKLITYPRSDSRYLPKEQLQLAPKVVAAVISNASELVANIPQPNTSLKSKVWNDSKVDAHHAIIPTEKRVDLTKLSANESKVYQQIARQYLAQFYPAYLYQETQVEVTIAGGKFNCKSKTEKSLGWKSLFKSSAKENSLDKTETQLLPPLALGQRLTCSHGELLERQTQPPKHFTDATLLSAMTGINRFVKDPEIKKVLKETDGLGTEATRAGIIELLFKRGFLKRQGKSILATEAGTGLIKSLPDNVSQPDMTALWESSLEAISRKETRYQDFMLPMQQQLHQLIEIASQQLPTALQGIKSTQSKKRFYRKKNTPRKAKRSS